MIGSMVGSLIDSASRFWDRSKSRFWVHSKPQNWEYSRFWNHPKIGYIRKIIVMSFLFYILKCKFIRYLINLIGSIN